MKKSIPIPVAVAAIVVVVLVGLGYGWSSMNSNGESSNPNAGKPTPLKGGFKGLSRQAGDAMNEETYAQFLKQNRPDLSDAEIKEKADAWWRIKSGQVSASAGPSR